MKIAIVAPSGIPYAVGGAEKFWWGMRDAINRYSTHEVELIKLPCPEHSFWQVVASYKAFSELDLSHFDCVISTKYPAWMVRHHNHICYLQHTLRGLYDTYPVTMAVAVEDLQPDMPAQLAPLLECLALPPERQHLERLFSAVADLQKLTGEEAQRIAPFCQLPGPLLRQLVHWLDRCGKDPSAIKRFYAISSTVMHRQHYFPPGVAVLPMHHPSDLGDELTTYNGEYQNYFFTASRLDAPKRIDMIIAAFALVVGDVELRIAGDGPELARLKMQAAGDARIHFLGRISDAQLMRQYRNTLAVPFVPKDEDYGLITLEAMQAAKAVITFSDSGGVNELLNHGENGFSVAADVQALALALQQLVDDRALAKTLGENARRSVAAIVWPDIVEQLLGEPAAALSNTSHFSLSQQITPFTAAAALTYREYASAQFAELPPLHCLATAASGVTSVDGVSIAARPRVVVAVSFAVYPPRGGGQNRIYHLYRQLAKVLDIVLVSLCDGPEQACDKLIAPGLRERRISKSRAHLTIERGIGIDLGASVGDLVAMKYIEQSPAYLAALAEEVELAQIVVASHHYLYPAIRLVYRGPLVYEAHNVEADMKQAVLGAASPPPQAHEKSGQWLQYNRQIEGDCARDAQLVTACSTADKERLQALYDLEPDTLTVIANGSELSEVTFADSRQRRLNKYRNGLAGTPVAVFMGSWHGPNIEAVAAIMGLAKRCPRWQFWIMGSVCKYFTDVHPVDGEAVAEFAAPLLSDNIRWLGVLSEAEKAAVLALADLALNPMVSGSGSNLKMMEYAAAGTPILSTPFGNRGLSYRPGIDVSIEELADFQDCLNRNVVGSGGSGVLHDINHYKNKDLDVQCASALRKTQEDYRWQVISAKYLSKLLALITH